MEVKVRIREFNGQVVVDHTGYVAIKNQYEPERNDFPVSIEQLHDMRLEAIHVHPGTNDKSLTIDIKLPHGNDIRIQQDGIFGKGDCLIITRHVPADGSSRITYYLTQDGQWIQKKKHGELPPNTLRIPLNVKRN